jgi:glutamate dehydrogenase (NADP+)
MPKTIFSAVDPAKVKKVLTQGRKRIIMNRKSRFPMSKLEEFYAQHQNEKEYVAAVREMALSLQKLLQRNPQYGPVFESLLQPEKIISFDVRWLNDQGKTQTNKGYRVEYSNLLGPYKGGLRFHPSVNLSILEMLAYEQTFKNALTGLALGGGKGGSDFDPKGKSEGEIERFCRAFMDQLYPYLGIDKDVPAGDIGVGGREITYLYDEYKKKSGKDDGALTGKSLADGGSLLRPEATGYGLCYYAEALLKDRFGSSLKGQKIVISGSGNVAIYAALKAQELGAKVVAMSDSTSAIYDGNGLDLAYIKELKEVRRGRLHDYFLNHFQTMELASPLIWGLPATLAFPCATQFEIGEKDAMALKSRHCLAVIEGSNMATTYEGVKKLRELGIAYAPGKASNAGGVTVSGFEMLQNKAHEHWERENVDARLKATMESIYQNAIALANGDEEKKDLLTLTDEAAFLRLARATLGE